MDRSSSVVGRPPIDRSIRRTVGSRLYTPGSQITVSKIPEYDPTGLPFWNIYIKEGKSRTIRVGGTLAGNFVGKFYTRGGGLV
jgi:hypothetical protein